MFEHNQNIPIRRGQKIKLNIDIESGNDCFCCISIIDSPFFLFVNLHALNEAACSQSEWRNDMKIIDAIKMMLASKAHRIQLLIDWRSVRQKHDDAKLDYERKKRDVSASVVKTSGIEIDDNNLFEYLGDFIGSKQRLCDPIYASECAARGKLHEVELEFAFDNVISIEKRMDRSLNMTNGDIDPLFDVKTNIMIVLPQNPCDTDDLDGDDDAVIMRIDSVVNALNLICTNCVSGKSPVCILIGCVKPIDVALFVKNNGGKMIFNVTNILHDAFDDEDAC